MASSNSPLLESGDRDVLVASPKPPSLRSVNSTSSVNSGTSLSRRPRIRSRSRTVTGGTASSPLLENAQSPSPSTLFPDRVMVDDEPGELSESTVAASIPPSSTLHLIRPPPRAMSTAAPGLEPRPALPSAFSRLPNIISTNIRDSMLTQNTESSVYPMTSGPPSPLYKVTHDVSQSSLQPSAEEDTVQYDGDDVSYRLKLLVNNTYFLPPAHARPDMSLLSTTTPPIPKKPTPTGQLLDYFKGGRARSKSKPGTPPIPAADAPIPILRTTSDGSTMQGTRHPLHHTSSTVPSQRPIPAVSRVVVVREKLPDLAAAARLAEQDMKARALKRDQFPASTSMLDPGDIDPTDAVDLPPPSDYPFAVQTSALRGFGVEESVGAAMLADRLPPKSIAGSSSFAVDDQWREALLKAAVGHSIDNLQSFSGSGSGGHQHNPNISISSMTSSPGLSMSSPAVTPPPFLPRRMPKEPRSPPGTTVPHGQDANLTPVSPASRSVSPAPDTNPSRAVTPATPLTPLSPPPRRQVVKTVSQSELPKRAGPSSLAPISTAGAASMEVNNGQRSPVPMTPPPRNKSRLAKKASESSFKSQKTHLTDSQREKGTSVSGASMYTAPDVDARRPSTTFGNHAHTPSVQSKASTRSRDSASTKSSPKPRRPSRASPRSSTSTTGPRAPVVPPRTSSLPQNRKLVPEITHTPHSDHEQSVPSPVEPSARPIIARRLGPKGRPLSIDPNSRISFPPALHSAPPPASPSDFFDQLQSQGNAYDAFDLSSGSDGESDDDDDPYTTQPALVPPMRRAVSPAPSFSSSIAVPAPAPPRASFMRLGNHSTPHVSPATTAHAPQSHRLPPPVGHIKKSAQPLSSTSKFPSLDFPDYLRRKSESSSRSAARSIASTSSSRRAARQAQSLLEEESEDGHWDDQSEADHKPVPAYKAKEQESLKKLNGLLTQHMEAEKTRMRAISHSVATNRRS